MTDEKKKDSVQLPVEQSVLSNTLKKTRQQNAAVATELLNKVRIHMNRLSIVCERRQPKLTIRTTIL